MSNPGDLLGSVLIEMIDNGSTAAPSPRITCTPIGRITSGWFDRHTPLIYREIELAQAKMRRQAELGLHSPPPLEEPTEESQPAPSLRRKA